MFFIITIKVKKPYTYYKPAQCLQTVIPKFIDAQCGSVNKTHQVHNINKVKETFVILGLL